MDKGDLVRVALLMGCSAPEVLTQTGASIGHWRVNLTFLSSSLKEADAIEIFIMLVALAGSHLTSKHQV
jgi:hypothetical protein